MVDRRRIIGCHSPNSHQPSEMNAFKEKNNAVTAWRETIGATNPEEAAEGTIRHDFATSLGENAVHGSDSDKNAKKEIGFFFSESELITNH